MKALLVNRGHDAAAATTGCLERGGGHHTAGFSPQIALSPSAAERPVIPC